MFFHRIVFELWTYAGQANKRTDRREKLVVVQLIRMTKF